MFIVWLLVGLAWTNSVEAKPQSARYTLNVQEIKGDADKMVSLRDSQTKRTLWKRKIYNFKATWSQDKRAVVLEGRGNLLVWREGHALRDFGVAGGYDYTMGCAWSPDNQRLLNRFGMSAMSDIGEFGAGRLFCLKLGSGNNYKYSSVARGVREMKWRDNKTVLYRIFDSDDNGNEIIAPLRKWRVK